MPGPDGIADEFYQILEKEEYQFFTNASKKHRGTDPLNSLRPVLPLYQNHRQHMKITD